MPENRGGARAPTPGVLYPNRTDLQSPQAPKGGEYGERQDTIASQQIQPIAGAPSPQLPVSDTLAPGNVPTLTDPTANPDQPFTAGMPSGPGPGMEGLSYGSFGPQELSILRGMYRRYNFEPLRQMIEQLETNL